MWSDAQNHCVRKFFFPFRTARKIFNYPYFYDWSNLLFIQINVHFFSQTIFFRLLFRLSKFFLSSVEFFRFNLHHWNETFITFRRRWYCCFNSATCLDFFLFCSSSFFYLFNTYTISYNCCISHILRFLCDAWSFFLYNWSKSNFLWFKIVRISNAIIKDITQNDDEKKRRKETEKQRILFYGNQEWLICVLIFMLSHGECPRKLWFLVCLSGTFTFLVRFEANCFMYILWISVCVCVNVKLSRQVWKVYLEFKHLYLNNKPYNKNNTKMAVGEREVNEANAVFIKRSFLCLLFSRVCVWYVICDLNQHVERYRSINGWLIGWLVGCVRDAGTTHEWKTHRLR